MMRGVPRRLLLLLAEREYDLGSRRIVERLAEALRAVRVVLWKRRVPAALRRLVAPAIALAPTDERTIPMVAAQLGARRVDAVLAVHEDCLRAAAAAAHALGVPGP